MSIFYYLPPWSVRIVLTIFFGFILTTFFIALLNISKLKKILIWFLTVCLLTFMLFVFVDPIEYFQALVFRIDIQNWNSAYSNGKIEYKRQGDCPLTNEVINVEELFNKTPLTESEKVEKEIFKIVYNRGGCQKSKSMSMSMYKNYVISETKSYKILTSKKPLIEGLLFRIESLRIPKYYKEKYLNPDLFANDFSLYLEMFKSRYADVENSRNLDELILNEVMYQNKIEHGCYKSLAEFKGYSLKGFIGLKEISKYDLYYDLYVFNEDGDWLKEINITK